MFRHGSLLFSIVVLVAPINVHADGPSHSWSQRFGDGGPQQGWSVATDAAGNVLLAGQFEGTIDLGGDVLSSVGGADIFLVKFDAAGNHLWSRNFTDPNYDNTPSIAIDAFSNVVMSGNFTHSIDFGGGPLSAAGTEDVNVFLVKFDPDGDHLWSRSFGGASTELTFSIAVDASSNIVWTGVFGQTIDFGGGVLTSSSIYDMYLVKFDSNGNHLWSDSYGQTGLELSTHIAVAASGNIVVAGRFNGSVNFGGSLLTTAGGDDIYLVKFSPGGSHLWSKRFGDASVQLVGGLAVDAEEDVVLAGSYVGAVDFGGGALTSAGSYDTFLAAFESDGDHRWSRRFGDASVQQAQDVAVDATGDVVVTGSFMGTMDFGGGALAASGSTFSDAFLAALDSDGNHVWSEHFGNASLDHASTVTVDPSHGIIVSGRFQGTIDFGGGPLMSAGDDDVFLAKFSPVATGVGPAVQRLALAAYPNPFNPSTTVSYRISHPGFVRLQIVEVSGRVVKTLVSGTKAAGDHHARWDGRDENGSALASGVYFARLDVDGASAARKIVLLK